MPSSESDCNGATPKERLAPLLADFPADLWDDRLYRSILWVDSYVDALSLAVLAALGADSALTTPASAATLCRALDLAGDFAPHLTWLLERAAIGGAVGVEDTSGTRRYYRTDRWRLADAPQLAAKGLAIDAGNRPTIALLQAAAAAWPRIARGEVSGEDALLNPEAIGLWLDYFDNANLLYAANNRVAAVIATASLAEKQHFSILELGAGAGSATEALLDELVRRGLKGRLQRYLVTEPSALFRRRGERRLKARRRNLPLQFAALDIDQPWADQLPDDGRFDLICGVNVLHVARDLAFSLGEARARLAPGGSLVAGECLRPFPDQSVYVEFVFQLLDSFKAVITHPDRRPRPGFLTPEEWQRSLTDAGFTNVSFRPDHRRTRSIFPHLYIAAICAQ
ncbi:class I SAM-dependent methyltransferase [Defluviicoccus vanus]|uniref:Class I SAM-dependent methyltransferase n=1 Tax=Defluviicoccus vanus TaxID=111831 RepID=A0A7H1MXF8_9PROT|nr:class I SAM-dependent methyltransferase [Defluviicoccus vanus]QNT68144.1 class I SAM-dependent methyltransferase [Defluviicoccus vanus]